MKEIDSFKRVTFRNVRDKTQQVSFRMERKGRTNIDLILKASNALKNPENWEFYEIRG